MIINEIEGLKVYHTNDFPRKPIVDGEEVWVYMGEGNYRKLRSVSGEWMDTKKHYYNQKES